MAFYPLKVKDDQGNTHVVGDPRILNGGEKAASNAPVAAIWNTVTVAGDVLTTGSPTTSNTANAREMSRFLGRRVRVTFPTCTFTALVAKVETIVPYNVRLTLANVTVESGNYPADGDVSVAGTTWLEDLGEFEVVLDSEPAFSNDAYGISGKSMYFEPVEEVIGQITGESTQVSIPVPVASDWAGVEWLNGGTNYPFAAGADYTIVAQWTGSSGTVPIPQSNWDPSAVAHTFEFTISGGDTVTLAATYMTITTLSPTWDSTATGGGVTGVGWASGTFQNGSWYSFSFFAWNISSSVNLDTNLPPAWPANAAQDVSSFTITQAPLIRYAYPTTISNPRTTYLNHPFYGLTVSGNEKMALRFANSAKHELYFAYLGPNTGFTGESGTSLLSTSSTEIFWASSESYPIDIVALATGGSSGVAFRTASGVLQGIKYDSATDSMTNFSGSAYATSNSAVSNLEVLGAGSPFARIDMNTFSSTLVATNVPNPRGPSSLDVFPNLYQVTFKLTASSASDFFAQQHNNPLYTYPVLYSDTTRAVAYDWWRHNIARGDQQFLVNGAWVSSASYDAATETFTLYTDRDLTPSVNDYRLPETRNSYTGLEIRLMVSSGYYPSNTTKPTSSSFAKGLSTGTFSFDGVGSPGAPGNLITSAAVSGNLTWRPTPGLVTKRYNKFGNEIALSDLEGDAYSGLSLGGSNGLGRRIRVMKLMVNINNSYQNFSSNHDLFMRFNPSSPVTARYATKSLDGSTGTESSYSTSGSGGTSYVNLGRAAAGSADNGEYNGDLIVTMSFRPQGTKFEATWLPGGVITNPKYTTSGTTAWTNDPANGGLEFYIAPTNSGTRKSFTWDLKTVIELHAEF